jgi:hypothetical protein
MKCPNCEVAFHEGEDTWEATSARDEVTTLRRWLTMMTLCPECEEPIVKLEGRVQLTDQIMVSKVIYPTSAAHIDVSSDVPDDMRVDYIEATQVLPISPKASAALSRRTLQSILSDKGYTNWNLSNQIRAVLSETDSYKRLPLSIEQTVKAVEEFGNFAAHQKTDYTTSQIIDVEPNEAEWCLEIVAALFEHYYVRPAVDAERLAALDEKRARTRQQADK